MKKKILIFSFAYKPKWGGAEIAIQEIASRTDLDFDMITFRFSLKDKKQEQIGNITVYRVGFFGGRLLFPFFACATALRLHSKKKYDSTWTMMANYAGFANVFFKYFQPQVPMLLSLQEGDPIPYIKRRVRFVYPIFKQIFTKADRIQSLSHYLADFAKEMGAKVPVEVVPNGVNLSLFSKESSDEEKTLLRKELGIKENEKVVITTSRLVVKNGIGDIIDAMQFLPENTKFLVLGVGDLEAELKAKVLKNNLSERVLFLGHVAYEKLPSYLHISDVFCRPSLSEGLGSSFIEAMAAGLPVVATNVGGIPDFLSDGKTGLFCELQNPKSIAEKIRMLFDNNELRGKIISNSKELSKKYEWNDIAKQMQNLLVF